MKKKNTLGKTTTLRVVVPIELCRRVEAAAINNNHKISTFIRVLLDEHVPQEGGKE
jgi:hypothetical protein